MSKSILVSIKKILGIPEDHTAFDPDILMHINSVFATLNQVGVGPAEGFMIEDDVPTWEDLLGTNPNLNSVKSYVYLKVRLLFDPPQTSYLVTALNEQVKELEWRLNVVADTGPSTTGDDGYVWQIDSGADFPVEAEVGDVGIDPVSGDVWRNA